jgi:hypothetical protein
MELNKNHSLKIEYGQGLTANTVSDVLFFNDREIRVLLEGKSKICIIGEKLKINGFNKQSGELKVGGMIINVKYLASSTSAIKRFFK